MDVNSIQSTQHYVITAAKLLHLDGLCINFLICCLYVKFYYPWSGPLKSWPPACYYIQRSIRERVVSVNWFLCFFLCVLCLYVFLQLVFFIHPSVKPLWLAQYNYAIKSFWCLECLNNCLDTNNSIWPNVVDFVYEL